MVKLLVKRATAGTKGDFWHSCAVQRLKWALGAAAGIAELFLLPWLWKKTPLLRASSPSHVLLIVAVTLMAWCLKELIEDRGFGRWTRFRQFAMQQESEFDAAMRVAWVLPAIAIVTGAVAEEVVFRGLVIPWIAALLGGHRFSSVLLALAVSAMASSLVFGIAHLGKPHTWPQTWPNAVKCTFAGAIYGFAFIGAGVSLWPSLIIHVSNNLRVALALWKQVRGAHL